jgi:hypothetical protein
MAEIITAEEAAARQIPTLDSDALRVWDNLAERRDEAMKAAGLDPKKTITESELNLTGQAESNAGLDNTPIKNAGLEVLLPQPGVVTLSTGEEVKLRKWTVGMLRHMTADLSLISVTVTTFEQFNLPDEDLVHQMVANNAEQLASLLQATLSWKQEEIDSLDIDDFEELALGLYKLNVGFFSKSRSMAKRLAATAEAQNQEA